MNEKLIGLGCSECGNFYGPDEAPYLCPSCGGVLETVYDYEKIGKFEGKDLWRYNPLLPTTNRTNLWVGGTPLYKPAILNEKLGLDFWIKDETQNPTHSLKDRASAIVVMLGKELGYKGVACASTGNAATSLAGISASEGLKSYIFAPKTISAPKLAQLQAFGAKILKIDASYDDCYDICNHFAKEYNWYNRNTAYNPYTIDGKKTVAFEIAEELHWEVPDRIYVPVGDGCIISSVWKGFIELEKIGLTDKLPELIGVQAEGCSPLKEAFDKRLDRCEKVKPNTLADSIAVGKPRNGFMALRDVRNSKGRFVSVTDEEMFQAMRLLGSTTGIFGELAAVASVAAAIKETGRNAETESAIALITGSGLKGNVWELFSDKIQMIEADEDKIREYIEADARG